MSSLRPPPYRKRPKPGDEDADGPSKLTEEQFATRDTLLKGIAITTGMALFAGVALILRELPGGGLPYVLPLSLVPSFVLWLAAVGWTVWILASRAHGRRSGLVTLVVVLALFAAFSLLGAGLRYSEDPVGFERDIVLKFG